MTIKKNNEDGQTHYVKHYVTSVWESLCKCRRSGEFNFLPCAVLIKTLAHNIQYAISGAVFCSNDFYK